MSDDPPLRDEGLRDDEPPPTKFPELLAWLRDTYTWREFTVKGKPAPDTFVRGYSQRMVAECLKSQGFKRCDQTRLLRMERGEDWPGKKDPREKQLFLHAAIHCFGLQHSRALQAVLRAALLLYPGAQGFPEDVVDQAFEVLRNRLEGNQP